METFVSKIQYYFRKCLLQIGIFSAKPYRIFLRLRFSEFKRVGLLKVESFPGVTNDSTRFLSLRLLFGGWDVLNQEIAFGASCST